MTSAEGFKEQINYGSVDSTHGSTGNTRNRVNEKSKVGEQEIDRKRCGGLRPRQEGDFEIPPTDNSVARKKLLLASLACFLFMCLELVGGYFANSLAIMTDAAHLLSDLAGFLISIFALWLTDKPATSVLSFGFHRAEILGALVSVLLIWCLTGVLIFEAVNRIRVPVDVDGRLMFIVATIGLGVNMVMGLILHQSGHTHSHGLGGGGHGHSHGGKGGHGHGHGGGEGSSSASLKLEINNKKDEQSSKQIHGEDGHGKEVGHGKKSGHGHSHGGDNGHGHSHGGDGHEHSHGGGGHGHSHGKGSKGDEHGHGGREEHGKKNEVHEHGSSDEDEVSPPPSVSSSSLLKGTPSTRIQRRRENHRNQTDQKVPLLLTNTNTTEKIEEGVDLEKGKNCCADEEVRKEKECDKEKAKKPQGNINVTAAFIHVIGDAVQSIGVMLAAALIWWNPGYRLADPICTFFFSLLVLFTTVQLVKQSVGILMEGAPEGIEPTEVEAALHRVTGVKEVHDLHIWSLSLGKPSLSVHIFATDDAQKVLESCQRVLAVEFDIHHTTIQVETRRDQIFCNPHYECSPLSVTNSRPLSAPLNNNNTTHFH